MVFDSLQELFNDLSEADKEKCGSNRILATISIKIDTDKNEMVLNKLYKHCEIDFHLFTELLKSFQRNFPDYYLFVPSLQGYELAREIKRFLGSPQVVCIYLKGDCGERFLEGEALKDVTFENILEDTKKHYEERGGIEKKKKELGDGLEISMFYRTNDEEEEILWMQIRIALSPK